MATGMTFTSLVEDLKRYTERGYAGDESVDIQIPRIINNTERSLANELKIQGYQSTVFQDLTVGQNTYAKPDRWRSTISMNIRWGNPVQRKTILPRGYEYLRAFWPVASATGEPRFYADYDYAHWMLAPTPDDIYIIEVLYWELPALLSEENQQNWLTQQIPNLLLYECLVNFEPFLKNDERLVVWKGLAAEEKAKIQGQDVNKIVDRAAVRRTA